jgi:hypothetical protein
MVAAIVGIDGGEAAGYERDDRAGSWWSSLLRMCCDPKSRKRGQHQKVPGLYAHGVLALKLHEDDGFSVTEVAALIGRDKGQTSRLIRQTAGVLRELIDPTEPLAGQLAETDGKPFQRLTDEQWGGIADRFPRSGRTATNAPSERQIADGLRFVLIHGGKWADAQKSVGIVKRTLRRRMQRMEESGELEQAVRVLRATDTD